MTSLLSKERWKPSLRTFTALVPPGSDRTAQGHQRPARPAPGPRRPRTGTQGPFPWRPRPACLEPGRRRRLGAAPGRRRGGQAAARRALEKRKRASEQRQVPHLGAKTAHPARTFPGAVKAPACCTGVPPTASASFAQQVWGAQQWALPALLHHRPQDQTWPP